MKSRGCNVGICGDTGNSLFVDCDPVEIYKAFASDIKHIHVKDYYVTDTPVSGTKTTLCGKYITEAPFGKGVVDFGACFALVPGYNGDISYEFSGTDEDVAGAVAIVDKLLNKNV